MTSKAKELNNRKDGDRNACIICNPSDRKNIISADHLWQLRHLGWRLK
jgi:hypothetical protein